MSVREMTNEPTKKGYSVEGVPATKYDDAKSEWFSWLGRLSHEKFSWKMVTLGLLFLNFFLSAALWHQSTKSTVSPFVIYSNNNGERIAIGSAQEGFKPPNEREVIFFISDFLEKTRTITKDEIANRNSYARAYKWLDETAAAKMDSITQQENTFKGRWNKELVTVKVHAMVPLSNKTYQVRWTEEVYDTDGKLRVTNRMMGTFVTDLVTYTKEEDLRVNPFGVIIRDFSWNKEL